MGSSFQPPGSSGAGAPAVPYTYQPYPKWVYHATYGGMIVRSPQEHADLGGLWQESPAAATAAYDRLQDQVSEAAAERAYTDRRMSAAAQAEVQALERESDGHVLDPPVPSRSHKKKGSE